MNFKHNKDFLTRARQLRKNMTKEEKHLWYDFLCDYQPKFRRQKIISPYIVDFYCAEAKLIIELDGSQHFELDAIEYDRERTAYLNALGLEVIRFTNGQINRDFQNVCLCIDGIVREKLSPQPPLNEGRWHLALAR